MKKIALIAVLLLAFSVSAFGYDFTIPIPDAKAIALRDTLCIVWDYDANKRCTATDPNDPDVCLEYESQKTFIENRVRTWIKNQANDKIRELAITEAVNTVELIEFE